MTEIGNRLLSHLPPMINKKGEIISAMFANDKGTGALEKLFAYGDTVKKVYADSDNVYKMESELIDQAMSVFSWFERFYLESDESFTMRNKSIFIRGYDETWGTTWNVKHVFEYYFPGNKIFLVENVGKWSDNLLTDSSFEAKEPEIQAIWEKENCSISDRATFSGEFGILFEEGGILKQSVEMDSEGYYFLTLAINGEADLTVKDQDGNSLKLWVMGEKYDDTVYGPGRKVKTDKWDFKQVFFKLPESGTVTVEVVGKADTKVDLVTLDKKTEYPRFVLYVWFEDVKIGEKTLHLSQNGEDPIPGLNYDNESYFDNSFFSSVSGKSFADDIYKDIMEMIKAAGTKGEIMLLLKESA